MRSAEPELYKDKIEISLDGRQVFYLFFGGAVIACLVFVLGVMVGRRVEARAHVDRGAATSTARDPLAALDQLDASSREGMSFRSSLAGGKTATSKVDDAVAAIEKQRAKKVAAEARAAAKATDQDQDDAKVDPKAEKAEKAEAEKAEKAEKLEAEKAARAEKLEAAKAEKAARTAAQAAAKAEPVRKPDSEAGHFTLQLSSFKEKGEADAFMSAMRDAGYKAYLVEADVEGKGTFFRVRYGSYDSYQAALEAKDAFERKVQKIAYVTRL